MGGGYKKRVFNFGCLVWLLEICLYKAVLKEMRLFE